MGLDLAEAIRNGIDELGALDSDHSARLFTQARR
jgi:hypothetical protein